ncbi:indigoidine synthase A-like protein [Piscinibacter sakaiensis]|uniref:Pseudouridine-5'-phosphate glycosidase n=1 Tax=Piscinibacter sakaiensis TaxID=1547922 RepID=A0A0K8P791_PISS1|nr:indigoidine synthase A-like protein [Piscinibacter sakaiensis]
MAAARAAGRPLVALESTLVAHGMPWPQNLETARAVEAIVRDEGAEPATIAVIDGRIRVGLDDAALERLARGGRAAAKVGRRDLAGSLLGGGLGATTVSGTLACAVLAGIEVFVTGGLGGVHRGAAQSFDVSADLSELARSPVAVVCAGAKSILDLPATLELLETLGVPVVGCGHDEFAAFYCRDSGLPLELRLDDAAAQARYVRLQRRLGLAAAVVFSNPVPAADALPRAEVDGWIAQALDEAQVQGIGGKAVTPFLLARLQVLSGGRSLAANIALVRHNARVGARLARALQAAG